MVQGFLYFVEINLVDTSHDLRLNDLEIGIITYLILLLVVIPAGLSHRLRDWTIFIRIIQSIIGRFQLG